jgi:hypothetical protein
MAGHLQQWMEAVCRTRRAHRNAANLLRHIDQRKQHRRVGPPRAGYFGLRAQVD